MSMNIIKTLWIGPSLSLLEQLSLKSFLRNGYKVELFIYDEVKNIPEGIIIRDANTILNKEKIFQYRKTGGYGAFANWFRYEMLFKEGGVWVDTDIICLKKFDIRQDLFFGHEDEDTINNAVIGTTPNLPLFEFLSRQAKNPNNFLSYDTFRQKRIKLQRKYFRGNKRGDLFHGETGPRGLTKAIEHFELDYCSLPIQAFYPVYYKNWRSIFHDPCSSIEENYPNSYCIHLWNEYIRRAEYNKDGQFKQGTLIELLKSRYLD